MVQNSTRDVIGIPYFYNEYGFIGAFGLGMQPSSALITFYYQLSVQLVYLIIDHYQLLALCCYGRRSPDCVSHGDITALQVDAVSVIVWSLYGLYLIAQHGQRYNSAPRLFVALWSTMCTASRLCTSVPPHRQPGSRHSAQAAAADSAARGDGEKCTDANSTTISTQRI